MRWHGGGGGVVPKIMEVNYEPILRNTNEEGKPSLQGEKKGF
jgi:hypothetical protein